MVSGHRILHHLLCSYCDIECCLLVAVHTSQHSSNASKLPRSIDSIVAALGIRQILISTRLTLVAEHASSAHWIWWSSSKCSSWWQRYYGASWSSHRSHQYSGSSNARPALIYRCVHLSGKRWDVNSKTVNSVVLRDFLLLQLLPTNETQFCSCTYTNTNLYLTITFCPKCGEFLREFCFYYCQNYLFVG